VRTDKVVAVKVLGSSRSIAVHNYVYPFCRKLTTRLSLIYRPRLGEVSRPYITHNSTVQAHNSDALSPLATGM